MGKTATTFNLGDFLAKQSKSVLLIDNDSQASLTKVIGISTANCKMTLTTLRCHAIDTPELLEESIAQAIQHRDNLNLLPAHQKRSGIAIRLSPYSVTQIVRTGTGIKLISYILLACIAILFQSIKVRIRIYK
ncbi:ParA family protein [Agathobaculum sp. LCP25S3_E8]|uniref:ParA family protein n=1 Tax=Agathobaculum sp. LCP25S3_E8 TaxID=3438735 RepID=UPI003F8DB6C1